MGTFFQVMGMRGEEEWGLAEEGTSEGLVAAQVRQERRALEDLSQQWVPLYVRTPGNGHGNAALVEKGAPGKLRPGRSYIARIPEFPEDTREARRKKRGAINLGVREIWMVGEIEEADRTYRPSPPIL